MMMELRIAEFLWIAFFTYWFAQALGVKKDQRREAAASRASHLICLFLSMALIFSPLYQPERWSWPVADPVFWLKPLGVVLTAAGHGFAIWARRHLGKNWSARVSLKEDHQLITTGPYLFVRHPIYTGILSAQLGSAIASGDYKGFLGVALFTASYVRKIRIEERFLIEHFGQSFVDFKGRTRALVPFLF